MSGDSTFRNQELDFTYVLTVQISRIVQELDPNKYASLVLNLHDALSPYHDDTYEHEVETIRSPQTITKETGLGHETNSNPTYWRAVFSALVSLADRKGLLLRGRESKTGV